MGAAVVVRLFALSSTASATLKTTAAIAVAAGIILGSARLGGGYNWLDHLVARAIVLDVGGHCFLFS